MSSKSSNTNKNNNFYKNDLIDKLKEMNLNKIDDLKIDLKKMTVKESVKLIKTYVLDKKLALRLENDKYYFLNDNTMSKLMTGLVDENAVFTYNDDTTGGSSNGTHSDAGFVDYFSSIKVLELLIVKSNKTKPGGGFFKYYHTTKYDLRRFALYHKDDDPDYSENCIITALREGGLSDAKIQMVKLCVMNRIIPKCKLKEVCEKIDISISLTSIRNDMTSKTESIGINKQELYTIGLVDEHYFIIDKTELTSYCINNYDDVKHINNSNMIYKKSSDTYKKSNLNYINSFKVVKLLLENKNKLLEPIPYDEKIMNTQFYDKVTTYNTLEYPQSCIKYQHYEPKDKTKFYKVYFDFETMTKNTHKPYLVCYETEDGNSRCFTGENCAVDMLNNLPDKKHIMLIAHNANYDCRFLLKYLSNETPLVKGSRILSCNAVYYRYGNLQKKIEIQIKDSVKIINMPLKKFGKSFNLDVEKEIMPYQLYTQSNIDKVYVPILNATEYLDKNEMIHFTNNIEKWNCRGTGNKFKEFNILTYSSRYCEMDCNVLRLGYEIFRTWMLESTELDVDNYITIQSLCSDYKLKEGCYDGVAMISGVVQHYISNCIVGGRCMTNSNKMYHVKRKLADFDACSLYPSAMNRMKGYLIGAPKVLDESQLNYNFVSSQSGYFIRVKIKRLGKKLQFPLISKHSENGVRMFSNEVVGEIIYIDKTALEDAIQFQDIDFEILDGYYFNEGHNDKIKYVIKHLYTKRKELKSSKNPAQMVLKELMNSMYGKTILKPIETETIVKHEKDYNKYIGFNYNYIQSSVKVGDRYYMKKIKSILNHFNYSHCGVEILSMSKRIMNEVMTLAESEGLNIWYQDTDSIHINYEEVELLALAFKNKYNRDLIGEDMSQFHIDFDLNGACGEIYSTESYFLAKKVYIDKLESVDKNNDVITGDHIRLKSVPTSCINHTSKSIEMSPMDMYKYLYGEGTHIKFDLTEDGKNCGFKYMTDMSVRSYEENEFTRTITFPTNIERIEIK